MLLALISIHLSRELGDSLHHWTQVNKIPNHLLVLLLQLSKSLLLHLLSSVWPGNVKIKGQFNNTQRLIKMVRSRVSPTKYEGFSKSSTCKRRRACCPASYSSPSCSSRPSRQGWPSSCHFSPGLTGVAHFYRKKTATILQHLHTEPVALIFILSTFLLFLLCRLPAHTSFNLKAEKMQF